MGSTLNGSKTHKHRAKRQYKDEVDQVALYKIIIDNCEVIEAGEFPKSKVQEEYEKVTGEEVAVSHITDAAKSLGISFKWGGIRNVNTDAVIRMRALEERVARIERELGLSTS